MRNVVRVTRLVGSAVLANALVCTAAQAHPLAAVHAHTNAGAIAIVLTAMACVGLAALVIKRKSRKTV